MFGNVIVAGGGAAAIRAACEAADTGAQVVMVTGTEIGDSGSTYYPFSPAWGIMYADTDSDREAFLNEILSSCLGCNKPELTTILVENSAVRYQELREAGLSFIPLNDIELKTCFGASLRGAVLDDVSHLKPVVESQIYKRNIQVRPDLYAVDLVVTDGSCHGLVCSNKNGELVYLYGDSVVLATGGAESLWEYRCAGNELMGSSYAMAARHGAKLVNLELIQFLLGTVDPIPTTLFYHFTLNTNPVVTDFYNNPLIDDVTPEEINKYLKLHSEHGPFTTMDQSFMIEKAIIKNSNKRNSINGMKVKYTEDIGQIPAFSRWVRYLKFHGIDYLKQEFKVYPHCQGFNGGIEIDSDAATSIPGLYACGESAGGIHGANRMGGNSILATQVFGQIAGKNAALFALKNHSEVRYRPPVYTGSGNCSYKDAIKMIRHIMQKYAFIERDDQGLRYALSELKHLEDDFDAVKQAKLMRSSAPYLIANAIFAGQLIVVSMLKRKETIGGHFRADYPDIHNLGLINPVDICDLKNIYS